MSRDLIIDELKVGKNPRTLFGNVQRGKIQVIFDSTTDADNPANVMTAQFADSILGANVIGIKGRGTIDAPANAQNNDNVFAVNSFAYSGGTYFDTGGIHIKVDNPAFVSGQNPPSRVEFHTSASNVTERMVGHFSSEGYFAIGTAFDPSVAATRAAYPLHVVNSGTGASLDVHIAAYETGNSVHFHLTRARGTFATPSNVVSGDNIGRFIGSAYSNSMLDTCEMRYTVDDTVTAGQRPASRISFWTNESNAAARLVSYFSREGYLGVGTAFDPGTAATRAAHPLHVVSSGTGNELFATLENYSTSANATYRTGRARGTFASPATVVTGDLLGEYEFWAYTNQWHHCAEIISGVHGTVVAGQVPDSDLRFFTTENAAGGLTLRMRLMPDGKLLLGSGAFQSDAAIAASAVGRLWIANNSSSDMAEFSLSGNNTNSPSMYFSKSRGTLDTPLTVATSDEIAYIQGRAYTNQWHGNVGAIRFRVEGTVTAGQRPGNSITLRTGAPGAGGPSDRVFVDQNGNVGINTSSFGASSQGVIGIGNAAAVPTGNPTGGGALYSEAGALKWRGSGGTTTTIAVA